MGKSKDNTNKKVNMTVLIDSDYYQFLKKYSFKLSVKEGEKIGLSEVVRRALDSYFDKKRKI